MTNTDRFIKVSKTGLLLPRSSKTWVAVHEPAVQLTYTRKCLPIGAVNWQAAGKACAELDLLGWLGRWRLKTRQEWARLTDDQRYKPAFDTDVFTFGRNEWWMWTGTECLPAGCAWAVGVDDGYAFRRHRSVRDLVRACCPSQVSGSSVTVLAA